MKDEQICELAQNVLGDLTRDINDTIYAELNGKLSIAWSTMEIYGAYASSPGESDQPPKHCITMYFEFVLQVWRDAENLCEFLQSIPEGSSYDKLYDIWDDRTKLPGDFYKNAHVTNMFLGAITWVYFHELSHLLQEHGIIRDEFGPKGDKAKKTTEVHDYEVSQDIRINGREALVSHVTELAADFEATHFSVMELIRHCLDLDDVNDEERSEFFSDVLYLMVCGLSLVFFRFNGNTPILPIAAVEGSHPKPLTRLEFLITQIFESLDLDGFRTAVGYALDRRQLVTLCTKAAFSATLYWSVTQTENHEFDTSFMLRGVLTRPVTLQYLQPIVELWDEMLPRILEVRRFGLPRGLMYFTDMARSRIKDGITWGIGPEASAPALSPPEADIAEAPASS